MDVLIYNDLKPGKLKPQIDKVIAALKNSDFRAADVKKMVNTCYYRAKIDDTNSEKDAWENRPIYQLSPYTVSWEVSRKEGKQIGKYLGQLFDNVEEKAVKSSKKPKGVKPGKSRRHGGYGIG